ncbi:unnamed protein product [Symbiodinium natans]|uniref:Uncharacterized protein n=1 Tax=Symbiodinium natans TaxID=878477 RepID=A0A812PGJ8_9DINO|nr:unnamed protein product [Symbiodinium natans]
MRPLSIVASPLPRAEADERSLSFLLQLLLLVQGLKKNHEQQDHAPDSVQACAPESACCHRGRILAENPDARRLDSPTLKKLHRGLEAIVFVPLLAIPTPSSSARA